MSGFHFISWLFVATVVLNTVNKGTAVCVRAIHLNNSWLHNSISGAVRKFQGQLLHVC